MPLLCRRLAVTLLLITAPIASLAGAVPLIVSSGPGAESRYVMGVVIMAGVGAATLFTLFVVPVAYDLLSRHSDSPGAVKRQLEHEIAQSTSER